ncbi:hypothetical protein VB716_08445 [Synechococcus sp. CCY9201]|uniref:hypothetical protein n=1 Tax=Synechococcus sp. CCY9201 TaxID=174697 RepID=UPI002B1FFF53|nr:hypothetical protein [Synechococcus sp. CCY9201]MEA5474249.1 hypothetical protein [Synechococcus sp. CCY9201]
MSSDLEGATMPAKTAWTNELTRLNHALGHQGPFLRARPIRLKVRSRPLEDGSRPVDVFGHFDQLERVTSRATGVAITPGNFEIRLPEARAAAEALVSRALEGDDTHAPRGWTGRMKPSHGILARQVKDAKQFLIHRSDHLGRCRPRQLETQLRWLAICEARAQTLGRELSIRLCLEALREHYGGISGAPYKQACGILKKICERLGLPSVVPDDFVPRYRYEPQPRTDTPSDEEICCELKAVTDPDEARLIYSVVVYGRRVAEIYYADWPNLADDGDLAVFAAKNKKRATSWPMPFGDEQIDLQGFRPPRWDELASIDAVPDQTKADQIRIEASKISRLIPRRLGCTATDLRHRWGAACLTDPRIDEDAYEIAAAMLTSMAMLEKTYTRELREYRKKKKASRHQTAQG